MKVLIFFFLLILMFQLNCTYHKDANLNVSESRIWTEEERTYLLKELNRTSKELADEIESLNPEQWHFHETPNRWSIAEIVEHLTLQNELHFRELSVNAQAPQMPQYIQVVKDWDSYFINYATDTLKGKARWFLEPVGRFCTKENAIEAFNRARSNLTKYVAETAVDFRMQFTFRAMVALDTLANAKPGQVRDLHQLILTGIAHTDRHLGQIRKIKEHVEYPK